MSHSITALYDDRVSAAQAVDQLLANGLTEDNISILMSDSTRDKEFSVEVNTKAPEGASIGAAVGGTLGAITAGLTAVGTITLTGGAGLLAAGPVVAALAGAGAGATAGGLTGGLIGLGFDENEAKLVEKDIDNGSILLAADVPDSKKNQVKSWLEDTNPKNVSVH